MTMRGDTFKGDSSPNTGASSTIQAIARLDDKYEYTSRESPGPSRNDHEGDKSGDKVQRRLAQNREAARKSRLRKKAYVQQLETGRLKLAQLEQELEKARQQGLYVGSYRGSGPINSGIAAFEIEYGHWVEEQQRQISELRNALQAHITDVELRMLVENALKHYNNLFRMKADAAKADVFYLMSGMWRTSAERFFLWMGGFRPSELLNVLMPQLEPLSEKQLVDINVLRESSQQAEDTISQGVDGLLQALAEAMASKAPGVVTNGTEMSAAAEKLDALEGFVNKADDLRQQTLQRLSSILTTRQAARGLLTLGEYFHRLRALSSLWAARPREDA